MVQQYSGSARFAAPGMGASLMEVSAFMAERLDAQLEKMGTQLEAQRQEYEAKLQHQEATAKAELQQHQAAAKAELQQHQATAKAELQQHQAAAKAELDKIREEMKPPPPPSVSDDQIVALQTRLYGMHNAELLTEDQLDQLEDIVLDYVEAKATSTSASGEVCGAGGVIKLVAVSEAVGDDKAFARQARRRFL